METSLDDFWTVRAITIEKRQLLISFILFVNFNGYLMRTDHAMSASREILFGFIESTPLHLPLERVTCILSEADRLIN